jgi:hypothetical protein
MKIPISEKKNQTYAKEVAKKLSKSGFKHSNVLL